VRGLANVDVTAELALDLSVAAAHVLADVGAFAAIAPPRRRARPTGIGRVPLGGRDRRPGPSAGVDVVDAGVLADSAIAFLTAESEADLGVMLSASHNPMPDNGIKSSPAAGTSGPTSSRMRSSTGSARTGSAPPVKAWPGPPVRRWAEAYIAHLLDVVPQRLDGLKVVVDCANGAASVGLARGPCGRPAESSSSRRSGRLEHHDGCGSTHLEPLQKAVRRPLSADARHRARR